MQDDTESANAPFNQEDFFNLTKGQTTMKRIILIAALAAFSTAAMADKYVKGYTRSDGSYVAPHYRSDANSNRYDNYSSSGNSNPYTGQRGSQRNEYSTTPQYNDSFNNGYGKTLNRIYGNDND